MRYEIELNISDNLALNNMTHSSDEKSEIDGKHSIYDAHGELFGRYTAFGAMLLMK